MDSSAFIENLRQLFAECDIDNNGSLGRDEFSTLCAKIGLNKEAASETFDRLDIDKNDRITFDEFAAGFNQYKSSSASASASSSTSTSPLPSQQQQQQQQQNQKNRAPSSTASNKCLLVNNEDLTTSSASPSPTTLINNNYQLPSRGSFSSRNNNNNNNNNNNQKLSPSPVASRARKSASPLGVMSLGSSGCGGGGGSSGNLIGTRSSSANTTADASSSISLDFNNSSDYISSSQEYGAGGAGISNGINSNNNTSNMVVYSSDMINTDYNGTNSASGSGQFGSLVSSSGSLNQVRNMQDLLECVQKLQSENQILTQIFFKDKREREEYINKLGEEFDEQVREVEERANRRAKEELENEKKRLREMMAAERETLQHHYKTIEKMSNVIKTTNNKKLLDDNESIDKVRSKLEDTYLENRQLKRSLLDTKTDVAMIWKEMEKLKKQYEDKLSSAYERNIETRSECDHIKQQLTLMKDSNRKLQDASDVITNYITDKVDPVIKNIDDIDQQQLQIGGSSSNNLLNPNNYPSMNSLIGKGAGGSHSNSRRGSILSEYLNGNDNDDDDDDDNQDNDEEDDSFEGSFAKVNSKFKNNKKVISKFEEEKENDFLNKTTTTTTIGDKSTLSLQKKNISTKSDAKESINKNQLGLALEEKLKKSSSSSNNNNNNNNNNLTSSNDSNQQLRNSATSNSINSKDKIVETSTINSNNKIATKQAQLIDQQKLETSNSKTGIKNIGRHFFIGSRSSSNNDIINSSLKDSNKTTTSDNNKSNSQNDVVKSPNDINSTTTTTNNDTDELIVEPADGPSKATFNIILVGDSFVGKSSFAARFMEGSFVQGLISNCSIDFKTKSYKVDGTNYTVNLWDTAGQERFRSITASYFRKADGIILMYDVTDKRSYLNVRNWMSTISDTASENVAVLLIGNKIDLRQTNNKEKCVPTEEGFRLAKEYDIVFLETSVKTGTNLVPSMGKLIRLIAKNNAPVEEDNDRIRLNDKSKVFNCMPKNC